MFFLIQDPPIVHTPSSVDINLDILSSVHGDPKTHQQFGETTRVFTRRISTAPMPTSSVAPIFESQTSENVFALPSSDITTDT